MELKDSIASAEGPNTLQKLKYMSRKKINIKAEKKKEDQGKKDSERVKKTPRPFILPGYNP